MTTLQRPAPPVQSQCPAIRRQGRYPRPISTSASRIWRKQSSSILPLSLHIRQTCTRRTSVLCRAGEQNDGNTASPSNGDGNEADEPEAALILIACGIGVATGASVVAFNDGIHFIRDAIWHGETLLTGRQLLEQFSELELWPRIVLPPILGGLFVGTLGVLTGGYTEPKKTPTEGSTSPAVAAQSEREPRGGLASMFRPVARAVAAAVTLGTGASLGPEGPSVDIGRSCAMGLGAALKSRERHLTSLLAAGSGAGVAAGFNAPIAGVFFAVETVLQKQVLRPGAGKPDQEQDSSGLTIAMVLLASVVAAVVSQAGLGSSPAFRVPEYRLESLYELPLYLVFGALCGAVSASFSYSARVAADAFDDLRQGQGGALKSALFPCLGGLTTGVLALGYPEILYQGFDNVNSVLSSNGDYAPGLLLQIVVLKIIATTISRGSGLQGGLYAPSIFIGAALGSAFGLAVHSVGDPSGLMLSAPQAYALVGVGAMLASNCGVPLTAVLLLFELTRDYLIIVPTLAAVGISFWISSLAAPGVRSAASRRRVAALAALSAVASKADADMFDGLKRRLRAAAVLQDAALVSDNSAGTQPWASGGGGLQKDSEGGPLDAAAAAAAAESLTLACAADRECLLLMDDMSLAQALALMEAEGQGVAVVLGSGGAVVGMVSRDVVRARELKEGGGDAPVAGALAANEAESAD